MDTIKDLDNQKDNEDRSSAITTSTESETFETWTLVTPDLSTDKTAAKTVQEAKVLEHNENYEVQQQPHRQQQDEDKPIESRKKDETHTDGELSDGISIISDSESNGRASPQPAPRRLSATKRLSPPKSTVQEIDPDNDSDNPDDIDELTKLGIMTPPNTPDDAVTASMSYKVTDVYNANQINERDDESTESESHRPTFQPFNFTYVFFIAIFAAILAIFGRMKTGPMLEMGEVRAVYSKLNEILEKTTQIETMIQDTLNGLDDRSYDQYSNMLIRIQELNEKFEANNLAMKDALTQLTKHQKFPAIKQGEPSHTFNDPFYGFERDDDPKEKWSKEYNPKTKGPKKDNFKYKPPYSLDDIENMFRDQVDKANAEEVVNPEIKKKNGRKKRDDIHENKPKARKGDRKNNDKKNYEHPYAFSKYFDDMSKETRRVEEQIKERKRNEENRGDYLKGEQRETNQKKRKNEYRREEEHINGQNHEERVKSDSHKHNEPRKNGYKERSKRSEEQNQSNGRKINLADADADQDWMERRKQYRENARSERMENDKKKQNLEEDSNWYLERATSRQKARTYETVGGTQS